MPHQIQVKNRFAVKMIAAFVIVILISTLFTSASFYFVSNSTVKNSARESSVQIAKQAADSLSFILNAGSDVSDLLYTDLRIQKVVKKDAGETTTNLQEWRENEEYFKGILNNIVYSSSFVNIAYVLKNVEQSWGSGTFSKAKLARYDLDELDWAVEARKRDGGLVWQGLQADRFSGAGDNTKLVLPIARVLKDFDTMDNIGYVLVNLNGQKIIEKIEQIKLGDTGGFFVVDQEGRIMIDPDTGNINRYVENEQLLRSIVGNDFIEFEFSNGGVPYYGVKQRLSNGWYIVGTVPVREITQKLDALNYNIMLSFVGFTLAGILVGLVIAGRVTRPIKQLTRQMKLAQQGDLSVRTHIHSNDELGLMSKQFNRMMADIDQLMEQVKQEQKQKQDAELRAVMHRINPHFLFNTLSTLRWLIKYDQKEKADKGMSALIRLLEANMGKKGNFVTIGEELDIIEKYLAILELRYSRRFVLDTTVDPQAAEFVIPRMLIQPLVENAIFHGIVPKGTDGELHIEALMDGEAAVIRVRDNGIGILPERKVVERSIEEAVASGQSGIGLQHVYESVTLYFGRDSYVTLRPGEQEGTVATIVLYPKFHNQEGDADASGHDRR
ncbi:cache domain-containing sensor histidine kinase [Paenibacillus thermotolerans]|uniref:cache domain-containing sensor histidine kinase n=1 Tax=Paenibacillus thermotolerans TaxID=3027807 RepID=UPI0023674800|nr:MULTISPECIES: sensor histidine kinase [unclassified Paenibacillus]